MPASVSEPEPSFVTPPSPLMALASVIVPVRLTASRAPAAIATPPLPRVPPAPPAPTLSVPAAIVVGPVWVLVAVSEVVPLPAWRSVPAPEIAVATVRAASVRSKARVAPEATLTAPLPSVPVEPPLPTLSVPAVTAVAPE